MATRYRLRRKTKSFNALVDAGKNVLGSTTKSIGSVMDSGLGGMAGGVAGASLLSGGLTTALGVGGMAGATGAGATAGAGLGATIGSIVPGIGTAIGAGVGGLAGGLAGLALPVIGGYKIGQAVTRAAGSGLKEVGNDLKY